MQVQTGHGIKLNGFYRGTVLQHLGEGFCKIFIYGVYPEQYKDSPDKLPSAEQASPLFAGALQPDGVFSYPHIGSTVWCFFQNGDQNYPVYFASSLGGELGGDVDSMFNSARQNVSVSKDQKADTTKNGTDAQVHVLNCGKNRVTIRESGQILIESAVEKDESHPQGTHAKIFIDASGAIRIDASDNIQLTAQSIKIDATKQLEINTDQMKIRSNTNLLVETAKYVNQNSNSHTVKSPYIGLLTDGGHFEAAGKKGRRLTV